MKRSSIASLLLLVTIFCVISSFQVGSVDIHHPKSPSKLKSKFHQHHVHSQHQNSHHHSKQIQHNKLTNDDQLDVHLKEHSLLATETHHNQHMFPVDILNIVLGSVRFVYKLHQNYRKFEQNRKERVEFASQMQVNQEEFDCSTSLSALTVAFRLNSQAKVFNAIMSHSRNFAESKMCKAVQKVTALKDSELRQSLLARAPSVEEISSWFTAPASAGSGSGSSGARTATTVPRETLSFFLGAFGLDEAQGIASSEDRSIFDENYKMGDVNSIMDDYMAVLNHIKPTSTTSQTQVCQNFYTLMTSVHDKALELVRQSIDNVREKCASKQMDLFSLARQRAVDDFLLQHSSMYQGSDDRTSASTSANAFSSTITRSSFSGFEDPRPHLSDAISTDMPEPDWSLFTGPSAIIALVDITVNTLVNMVYQHIIEQTTPDPHDVIVQAINNRCDSIQNVAKFIIQLESLQVDMEKYLYASVKRDPRLLLLSFPRPAVALAQSLYYKYGRDPQQRQIFLQGTATSYCADLPQQQAREQHLYSKQLEEEIAALEKVGKKEEADRLSDSMGQKLINQRRTAEATQTNCAAGVAAAVHLMDPDINEVMRQRILKTMDAGGVGVPMLLALSTIEVYKTKISNFIDVLKKQQSKTGCFPIAYQHQIDFERGLIYHSSSSSSSSSDTFSSSDTSLPVCQLQDIAYCAYQTIHRFCPSQVLVPQAKEESTWFEYNQFSTLTAKDILLKHIDSYYNLYPLTSDIPGAQPAQVLENIKQDVASRFDAIDQELSGSGRAYKKRVHLMTRGKVADWYKDISSKDAAFRKIMRLAVESSNIMRHVTTNQPVTPYTEIRSSSPSSLYKSFIHPILQGCASYSSSIYPEDTMSTYMPNLYCSGGQVAAEYFSTLEDEIGTGTLRWYGSAFYVPKSMEDEKMPSLECPRAAAFIEEQLSPLRLFTTGLTKTDKSIAHSKLCLADNVMGDAMEACGPKSSESPQQVTNAYDINIAFDSKKNKVVVMDSPVPWSNIEKGVLPNRDVSNIRTLKPHLQTLLQSRINACQGKFPSLSRSGTTTNPAWYLSLTRLMTASEDSWRQMKTHVNSELAPLSTTITMTSSVLASKSVDYVTQSERLLRERLGSSAPRDTTLLEKMKKKATAECTDIAIAMATDEDNDHFCITLMKHFRKEYRPWARAQCLYLLNIKDAVVGSIGADTYSTLAFKRYCNRFTTKSDDCKKILDPDDLFGGLLIKMSPVQYEYDDAEYCGIFCSYRQTSCLTVSSALSTTTDVLSARVAPTCNSIDVSSLHRKNWGAWWSVTKPEFNQCTNDCRSYLSLFKIKDVAQKRKLYCELQRNHKQNYSSCITASIDVSSSEATSVFCSKACPTGIGFAACEANCRNDLSAL